MKEISSMHMLVGAGAGVTLLLVVGGVWAYERLDARLAAMASTTEELAKKQVELSDALYAAQQGLADVGSKLGGFEEEVGDISGTVDILEKLKDTDRELLQKYSKVFFLNEHYAPKRLAQIDEEYDYKDGRVEKISAQVWPLLRELFEDAADDSVQLFAKSAYRSFAEQKALKSSYTVLYGADTANAFSADQGYSEHQLGTTLDFVAGQSSALDSSFEKTDAYAWLVDNAYKYGFVLSYPKGNQYYIYEPWHWRFVGVKLATYLHKEGKNFYDLEQRDIDEYLPEIFD